MTKAIVLCDVAALTITTTQQMGIMQQYYHRGCVILFKINHPPSAHHPKRLNIEVVIATPIRRHYWSSCAQDKVRFDLTSNFDIVACVIAYIDELVTRKEIICLLSLLSYFVSSVAEPNP